MLLGFSSPHLKADRRLRCVSVFLPFSSPCVLGHGPYYAALPRVVRAAWHAGRCPIGSSAARCGAGVRGASQRPCRRCRRRNWSSYRQRRGPCGCRRGDAWRRHQRQQQCCPAFCCAGCRGRATSRGRSTSTRRASCSNSSSNCLSGACGADPSLDERGWRRTDAARASARSATAATASAGSTAGGCCRLCARRAGPSSDSDGRRLAAARRRRFRRAASSDGVRRPLAAGVGARATDSGFRRPGAVFVVPAAVQAGHFRRDGGVRGRQRRFRAARRRRPAGGAFSAGRARRLRRVAVGHSGFGAFFAAGVGVGVGGFRVGAAGSGGARRGVAARNRRRRFGRPARCGRCCCRGVCAGSVGGRGAPRGGGSARAPAACTVSATARRSRSAGLPAAAVAGFARRSARRRPFAPLRRRRPRRHRCRRSVRRAVPSFAVGAAAQRCSGLCRERTGAAGWVRAEVPAPTRAGGGGAAAGCAVCVTAAPARVIRRRRRRWRIAATAARCVRASARLCR